MDAAAIERVRGLVVGGYWNDLGTPGRYLQANRDVLSGAVALGVAAGRDVRPAVAGRLYLLRVAAPHVADALLGGSGPGSFAALWPGWEARAFATGAAGEADRPFAAPQDHAHCEVAFAQLIPFVNAARGPGKPPDAEIGRDSSGDDRDDELHAGEEEVGHAGSSLVR